jgi:hypothetical protein
MVGWGTEPTDIENPQKVASSEGEELYVGKFDHIRYLLCFHPTPTDSPIAKKLLEKSELLKGLMQGILFIIQR